MTLLTRASKGLPLTHEEMDANWGKCVERNVAGTRIVVDEQEYALMPVDANGNVLVNIGHRQNTLANLLALDGVPGEISVATDVDALVVHNGVAGQAKDYRRTKQVASAIAGHSGTSLTATVSTPIDLKLNAAVYDPDLLIDTGLYTITIPSGVEYAELTLSGKIYPYPAGSIPAVGDVWNLKVQLETGVGTGVYADEPGKGITFVSAVASEAGNTRLFAAGITLPYLSTKAGRRLKVRMENSSAIGYRMVGYLLRAEFNS